MIYSLHRKYDFIMVHWGKFLQYLSIGEMKENSYNAMKKVEELISIEGEKYKKDGKHRAKKSE
jgi:hypothetical protein